MARSLKGLFLIVLVTFVAFAEQALAQPLNLAHTFLNPTPAGNDNVLIGSPFDDTGATYLFDGSGRQLSDRGGWVA